MKAIKLIIFSTALFLAGIIQAQISVRVNLGSPPMWGPAGYSDARYYYLPDVEAYYDVPSSMFIYQSGGVWIHRTTLPYRYRNYYLYNGYKVVMTDYRGNKPYYDHKDYRRKYAKGYHGPDQRNIGMRPEKGNYNKESNRYKEKNKGYGNAKDSKNGKNPGHNKGKWK